MYEATREAGAAHNASYYYCFFPNSSKLTQDRRQMNMYVDTNDYFN